MITLHVLWPRIHSFIQCRNSIVQDVFISVDLGCKYNICYRCIYNKCKIFINIRCIINKTRKCLNFHRIVTIDIYCSNIDLVFINVHDSMNDASFRMLTKILLPWFVSGKNTFLSHYRFMITKLSRMKNFFWFSRSHL